MSPEPYLIFFKISFPKVEAELSVKVITKGKDMTVL